MVRPGLPDELMTSLPETLRWELFSSVSAAEPLGVRRSSPAPTPSGALTSVTSRTLILRRRCGRTTRPSTEPSTCASERRIVNHSSRSCALANARKMLTSTSVTLTCSLSLAELSPPSVLTKLGAPIPLSRLARLGLFGPAPDRPSPLPSDGPGAKGVIGDSRAAARRARSPSSRCGRSSAASSSSSP